MLCCVLLGEYLKGSNHDSAPQSLGANLLGDICHSSLWESASWWLEYLNDLEVLRKVHCHHMGWYKLGHVIVP